VTNVPFEIPMFWKEFGFWATATGLVFAVIWRFFIKGTLIKVCDERTKSIKYAILVGESIRNPKHDKNNPLSREYISRHEVIEEIKGVKTTVEVETRGVKAEIQKRCGTPDCPVVPLVKEELRSFLHTDFTELQKEIDKFIADTKEIRGKTHETVEEIKKINDLILRRFDSFATEFGSKSLVTIDRLAGLVAVAGKDHDRER